MRNLIIFISITIFLTMSVKVSNAQDLKVRIVTPDNKTDFCVNQPITLVAQANIVTDEVINFNWEGDLSIVEKNLGSILILKPSSKGIYTFTVLTKDNEGNQASSSITINIKPVFKPFLKLKNSRIEIDTKENNTGCSFSYYYGNQLIDENEFKNAKLPGKYYVITTTPDGCSASSNILDIH